MAFMYQLTDSDCGTATFLNAISYLCKRREIKPDLVKKIVNTTSDILEKDGSCGGTSNAAAEYLVSWINMCWENCGFPVRAEAVAYENAERELSGADFARTCFALKMYDAPIGCEHYFLVTGFEKRKTETLLRVFDCNIRSEDRSIRDENCNRKVAFDLFRFSRDHMFELGLTEPILIKFSRVE